METPNGPSFEADESGNDSPETVSVEDVLALLESAKTDVELNAMLAEEGISAAPRPDNADIGERILYENHMLEELLAARGRRDSRELLDRLMERVRELKSGSSTESDAPTPED